MMEHNEAPITVQEQESKPRFSFIRVVNKIADYPQSGEPIVGELQPLTPFEKAESLIMGLNAFSAAVHVIEQLPFSQEGIKDWVRGVGNQVPNFSQIDNYLQIVNEDNPQLLSQVVNARHALNALYLGILGTGATHNQQYSSQFGYQLPADAHITTVEINSPEHIDEILEDWDGLAHDTRTPITSIKGYGQFLSLQVDKKTNEQLFESKGIQVIRDQVEYFKSFLNNDALDYIEETEGNNLSLADFNEQFHEILLSQLPLDTSIQVKEPQLLLNDKTIQFLEDQVQTGIVDQTKNEVLQVIEDARKIAQQNLEHGLAFEGVAITPSPDILALFKFHGAESLIRSVIANEAWNLPKTFARRKEIQPERNGEPEQLTTLYFVNEEGRLEIQFRDNGVGMDDEIEQNGFKKKRSKWGSSSTVTGTGVGLGNAARRLGRRKFNTQLKGRSVRDGDKKIGAHIILDIPLAPTQMISPFE